MRLLGRKSADFLERSREMDNKLNKDVVRLAYRLLLGREPESEKVIQNHLALGSLEKVRSVMMGSAEFKSKVIQTKFSTSKWVATDILDRFVMWIDLHDAYVSHGCLNNNYEPEETSFFMSRLRSGDVVLDIGANIGWFTLVAAKHIGPSGQVHAFEPRPETARMLKRTIADNDLRSIVHVWEYALSDKAEELHLAWGSNTDNPGGSFLSGTHGSDLRRPGQDAAAVIACRLDDVLPGIAPDIIKIDVEGAEPMALAGAREALARKRPTILSELYPAQLEQVSRKTAAQFISQIEEYGYGCYMLENGQPAKRLKDFPANIQKELVSVVFEWRGGS
jgi:FkbM family methyltransferase